MASAANPRKKRKKLRIKPGEVAGSRVVFDEEGVAHDPLELVAQRGSNEYAMLTLNSGLLFTSIILIYPAAAMLDFWVGWSQASEAWSRHVD